MEEQDDVMDLLNPKRQVEISVKREFSNLKDNYSVLLMIEKEKYETTSLFLTKKLIEDFETGIYVTVNKESSDLIYEMEAVGINTSKIHFIDAVTQMVSEEVNTKKNVELVSSPNELVELNVLVECAIKKKQKGFLIFDSLTTLEVYNDEKSVEKFAHSLSQETKNSPINDVFLIMKHSKVELIETIAQFFDKIIEL
jgi:archaellum biogenesis ATPase FlaH